MKENEKIIESRRAKVKKVTENLKWAGKNETRRTGKDGSTMDNNGIIPTIEKMKNGMCIIRSSFGE